MNTYYKVVSRDELAEATDEKLVINGITYKNPSLNLLHKLGYWPMDPECPQPPKPEEGYKIFDDGWCYVMIDGVNKIVTHKYRKLKIVDPGYPVLKPNQEIVEDRWVETDTEYIHIITVYDVIDEKPEIDETTHHLKEKYWEMDDVNKRKIAHYVVVRRVDEKPELKDKEEIVADWWDYKILPAQEDVPEEEVYFHFYKVMTVIRNPPDLKPGEQIVDEWFQDDEATNTRTYFYKVMIVVDNPPVLEPGQQIVDRWYEDNEETNTRTYYYEVRYIVDVKPELKENERIEDDWWEDDGKTRTHVYEVHQYIDEKPILQPGQDVIHDEWVEDHADPLHIVHTHVYEVRFIIDHEKPEVKEPFFIYSDWWRDDGTNYEHIWEVWEHRDEPRPEVDEYWNRVVDLGIVDDPEQRTRGQKWFVKPIQRNKPEDDPEGNFKWVEDGEIDHGDYIEITYRQVFKTWRVIDKVKLLFGIQALGKLNEFFMFLDNYTYDDPDHPEQQPLKVREVWNAAPVIHEDNPKVKEVTYAFKKYLYLLDDEETYEALLEKSQVIPANQQEVIKK